MSPNPRLLTALLAVAPACTSPTPRAWLHDQIGTALVDCNAAEVNFLAAKHDIRLAFEPCHKNEIQRFAWSPDGLRLAFGLPASDHVLQAERPTRNIVTVPAAPALAGVVWLSPDRVVFGRAGAPPELVIYDPPPVSMPDAAGAVRTVPAPALPSLQDLLPGASADAVTAITAEGAAWAVSLVDGSARQLPGLDAATDAAPGAGLVAVARDSAVLIVDPAGALLSRWPDADRGALSADGRWLLLEGHTAAASPFVEASDDAADDARRAARAEAYAAVAPEWAVGEASAPTLSVVDLHSGERWQITAFSGDHPAWYGAKPGWITFGLWSVDGRRLRRNVALVDLGRELERARRGDASAGVAPWTAPPP